MTKKIVTKHEDTLEDFGPIMKWGKLVTKITAIGVTLTGAFAALFSSSSVASGIALTAAGASTLAAAEKLPDQRYIKTKHVPPRALLNTQRKTLAPDILARPEKITSHHATRAPTSFKRNKI